MATFAFGEPTPDPEALVAVQGVPEADLAYDTLRAHCFGVGH